MNTKQNWKFILVLFCAVWISSCCKLEFLSISPDQVQQGDLNIEIAITSKCTHFEEGNMVILFTPPEGITIQDVIVEDPTTLSFLINVAEDTPVGFKDVVVTYDVGKQVYSITGINRLEVLPAI